MKNIVLFILSILVVYGILNLIYLTADWLCNVLPPFAIYLIIVGGFSAMVYFIYRKEIK